MTSIAHRAKRIVLGNPIFVFFVIFVVRNLVCLVFTTKDTKNTHKDQIIISKETEHEHSFFRT